MNSGKARKGVGRERKWKERREDRGERNRGSGHTVGIG